MALLNKLFSSRKKNQKHQDKVCERLFEFSKDQVRVILFRECDFRGRRLLFDSNSVTRTTLNELKEELQPDNKDVGKTQSTEKFTEISNGFGYTYTKPHVDVKQLGEMIFGSVAMSYRGTSYKIHSLNSPHRLMYTQVFPSPRSNYKCKRSLANGFSQSMNGSSNHSLEMSMRLDDSEVSSMASMSEHLSCCSMSSEAVLVCRRDSYRSVPMDVPRSRLSDSPLPFLGFVGDSGYCGDQSFSSISSGPQSISLREASPSDVGRITFSSGSLYKRWLRSMSTSLERSGSQLNGSQSTDECYLRTNPRSSKLGLTIIIQLSSEQEENMSNFLMEHASLVEAIVWRARHEVEQAYVRVGAFVSLMYDMSESVARCIADFFSSALLPPPLWWLALSSGCDIKNPNSISDIKCLESANRCADLLCSSLNNSLNESDGFDKSADFTFLNLTRFLVKGEKEPTNVGSNKKNSPAEKFVKEFCELLETVDIKHTNFFISTLLTAVLTHHLGWVATALPATQNPGTLRKPCNAFWGQLTDLYGAVGHPTKVAHTIITGTNKGDMISKILNSLTYFIRCNELERRNVSRSGIKEENDTAAEICRENSCIPKEYYKKFEDHLKEMTVSDRLKSIACVLNNEKSISFENATEMKCIKKSFGKTPTCVKNLNDFAREEETTFATCNEKVDGRHLFPKESNDVIFTLGDDDKLIGLKNGPKTSFNGLKRNKTCFNFQNDHPPVQIDEPSPREVTFSEMNMKKRKSCIEFSVFDDEAPKIEPTRPTFLNLEKPGSSRVPDQTNRSRNDRSQSVPPGDSKTDTISQDLRTKYRHSGIKFNFQQYPQIAANYLKSKNIELSNLPFTEKGMDSGYVSSQDCGASAPCSYLNNCETEEIEALQTPSNASELECISDLVVEKRKEERAEQSVVGTVAKTYVRLKLPNVIVKEECSNGKVETRKKLENGDCEEQAQKMKTVYLPMPKTSLLPNSQLTINYPSSLMRGLGDRYMSDMVLQGTCASKSQWESALRQDLILSARHPLLDQPVQEAVAIIANTDTWEVQLMSSHTFVVDKGSTGLRVGMSQLVANMLESLLHMWRLHASAEHCLMHIEQRLEEFCIRSKALAHYLLATEFCSMDLLTSTLQLEVNDVPLLMAVASTHSPQVTEKYGLSFQ